MTRESYPGWIVAPAENRDSVWTLTNSWLPYLLGSLTRLSLGAQISVLHELNWRLEVCLIPLWQDFAGHISRTLRVVNPFPGSIEIPGCVRETRR